MENASFFNYDSAFATRLRKLIEENNISKNQLSEEIGVSRQAISQYCDGSTIPNADKLLKIAEFFNVSLDYLVGRTENFTTDNELRFVCDYTGLNEEAIQKLQKLKGFCSVVLKGSYSYFYGCGDFINFLLQHLKEEKFFQDIHNYNNLIEEASEEFEAVLNYEDYDTARELLLSANFKQKVSRACFYDLNEALKDILYAYLTNGSEDIEQARSEALNYISELEKRG